MSQDLTPQPDNQLELTPMVRHFIAQKLHGLLDALDPYIDGTMGPVSTRHVQQYVAALKLLGQLYRVYDRAAATQLEQLALDPADALRGQILAQLEQLEQRHR